MSYAPVLLFVYNRPWHTKQTVEALQRNVHAEESDLFIYSDAPNGSKTSAKVEEVRTFVRSVNGFKNVTIREQSVHLGLADSIIKGVTDVVNEYGKVIVLEDDIVTSRLFLTFMNDALQYYENEKRVWHISGWNYPISTEDIGDVFFWRVMNCWGWGTWSDRWKYFEKNPDRLIRDFTAADIKTFNLDGAEGFWNQVLDNVTGKKNTWAIFWYATIFKRNGLCLNPSVPLIENIGFDGTGQHCVGSNIYYSPMNEHKILNVKTELSENSLAVGRVMKLYDSHRPSFIKKIFLTLLGRKS